MSPDGFAREALIDAPADVVWRAVSQPEHLAGWFCDAAVLEPRPGSKGVLTFQQRATHVAATVPIVVQRVEPPCTLAFRWLHPEGAQARPGNSLRVEFHLTSEGDKTRVQVIEDGLLQMDWTEPVRRTYADEHGSGWDVHLSNLREYVSELDQHPRTDQP